MNTVKGKVIVVTGGGQGLGAAICKTLAEDGAIVIPVDVKAEKLQNVVEEINGRQIEYKAGQFFTLLVDLHNKEIRRSYSISSAPNVDEDIYFTIKRIENGELSRYLFDTLKAGDTITTLPATGRFTIEEPEDQKARSLYSQH